MAYRKSTLRSMFPVTRKVARLIGEQDSIARRFKNLVPEIQSLEHDSRALATAKQAQCPELVTRKLAMVKSLSSVTYLEIHNVDPINHTMNVINEHASEALELLSPPQRSIVELGFNTGDDESP